MVEIYNPEEHIDTTRDRSKVKIFDDDGMILKFCINLMTVKFFLLPTKNAKSYVSLIVFLR